MVRAIDIKRDFQRVPLHRQVEQRLREHISELPAGHKLPSDRRLAKDLNLSIPTIREAMTTLAHEGLVDRRPGRGTIVRERHAPPQHVAVYARVDLNFAPPNTFSSLLSARLLSALAQRDTRARMYWLWDNAPVNQRDVGPEEFKNDLAAHRISAVGNVQGCFEDEMLEQIQALNIPLVLMGRRKPSTGWAVAEDEEATVERAVEYLVSQGRRNIALLGWGGDEPSPDWLLFQRAVAARGLPVRPEWARWEFHPSASGGGYAEFREIWTARAEKPDGLLLMDDILVPEVATAIQEMQIAVPGRLTVVAHAIQGAMTCPHFPALRFETDLAGLAEAMAEMLAQLSRGETPARSCVTVPVRWVEISGGSSTVVDQSKWETDLAHAVATKE